MGSTGHASRAHSGGIGYIYECSFDDYITLLTPYVYLHDYEITLGENDDLQD